MKLSKVRMGPMFVDGWVNYYRCKYKMTSIRGQASWAKIASPGGQLKALAYHLTKKLNKAEELTYLPANIRLG